MNDVTLMILAPIRALIINWISMMLWPFNFPEEPQQNGAPHGTEHGSNVLLFCALTAAAIAVAGGYAYLRYRRSRS